LEKILWKYGFDQYNVVATPANNSNSSLHQASLTNTNFSNVFSFSNVVGSFEWVGMIF
jgi:uncharacterized protein YjbI with pentapeptide repeats